MALVAGVGGADDAREAAELACNAHAVAPRARIAEVEMVPDDAWRPAFRPEPYQLITLQPWLNTGVRTLVRRELFCMVLF